MLSSVCFPNSRRWNPQSDSATDAITARYVLLLVKTGFESAADLETKGVRRTMAATNEYCLLETRLFENKRDDVLLLLGEANTARAARSPAAESFEMLIPLQYYSWPGTVMLEGWYHNGSARLRRNPAQFYGDTTIDPSGLTASEVDLSAFVIPAECRLDNTFRQVRVENSTIHSQLLSKNKLLEGQTVNVWESMVRYGDSGFSTDVRVAEIKAAPA